MFPATSRYSRIETATWVGAEGRQSVYLRRRFLPPAPATIVLTEHVVTQAERLDNITARYLGDPEQFWRLADGNNAMDPNELTSAIGGRLRIPLPQGG
jgi:hypothetical protein